MVKVIIGLVSIVIVCVSLCYMTNRVCNTVDNSRYSGTQEHIELANQHKVIVEKIDETNKIAKENNAMLKFLCNAVNANMNQDYKVVR